MSKAVVNKKSGCDYAGGDVKCWQQDFFVVLSVYSEITEKLLSLLPFFK